MTDERPISAHEGPRIRPRIGKVGRGLPSGRCADPPAPALRAGIAEFNRGEFFEQHETLEAAWIEEDDPVRYLYQGILQIGVGFHHLSRGNSYGARRLWARGIVLLEPFRSGCMNVDVDRLVEETQGCIDALDAIGITGAGEFDQSLIPQVHWLDGAASH
jgi:predicted metal-dependent hydrolase